MHACPPARPLHFFISNVFIHYKSFVILLNFCVSYFLYVVYSFLLRRRVSVGSVVCCVELSDVSLSVCSIVDYRFIGQWYRIKADGWIA